MQSFAHRNSYYIFKVSNDFQQTFQTILKTLNFYIFVPFLEFKKTLISRQHLSAKPIGVQFLDSSKRLNIVYIPFIWTKSVQHFYCLTKLVFDSRFTDDIKKLLNF